MGDQRREGRMMRTRRSGGSAHSAATPSNYSPCSTPTGPTAYSSKAFAESSPAWNCGGVSEVLAHRVDRALRDVELAMWSCL
jgi:hypothetical protein